MCEIIFLTSFFSNELKINFDWIYKTSTKRTPNSFLPTSTECSNLHINICICINLFVYTVYTIFVQPHLLSMFRRIH